jgi:16S rRNA (guanine527-N7)-methyltransferase
VKRLGLVDPHHRIATLLDEHDAPATAAVPLGILLDRLADPEAPTAVHDPARGVDIHLADSLAGLAVPEIRAAGRIADLGAGAGLPGLVLAATLPDATVVLVESIGRKCTFLRATIAAMDLANAEVVCARAEAWPDGLGRCDVVSARALAALPVLCEYAAPLLRDGWVLGAWKGAVGPEEHADAEAAAGRLGLTPDPVREVVPYRGSERRTLHVLRKTAPTPPEFPRREGMATKRPLSAKNVR